MILSHMASSSLDMSSYQAMWTHFRSILVIFINLIFKNYLSELQISGQMDAQPSVGRWSEGGRRWSEDANVHDGFLDSRWVPGFTIGSWIHDGSSILRKAEDLNLDARRHYVTLAKALDGTWPVGHACAVPWLR